MNPVLIAYLIGIPVAMLVLSVADQIYDFWGDDTLDWSDRGFIIVLRTLICLAWPVAIAAAVAVAGTVGIGYVVWKGVDCLARFIVRALGLA